MSHKTIRCCFRFLYVNARGFFPPQKGCLLRNGGNVTTEVDDGTSWLVEERCANCSCAAGRLQCSPIVCDCANNDYARSVCCGHCNEQASCAHQELANVRFLSGQQWIYQCQTCECLVRIMICCYDFPPPLPLPLPSSVHDSILVADGSSRLLAHAMPADTASGLGLCRPIDRGLQRPRDRLLRAQVRSGRIGESVGNGCYDRDDGHRRSMCAASARTRQIRRRPRQQ